VFDRRLTWMVLGLAGLLLALAARGVARASAVEAGPAGVLGIGLLGAGIGLLWRRRVAERIALVLSFFAAAAMAARATESGRVVPALPVGLVALALAWAILAERRRLAASDPRRASRGPFANRRDRT
jgi:hypothetical protein